jgi:hypothetical protein
MRKKGPLSINAFLRSKMAFILRGPSKMDSEKKNLGML